MIPFGVAFLFLAWVSAHFLVIPAILVRRARWVSLIAAALLMAAAYLLKPYTYDLDKYSIFFVTGYIQTVHWHTPNGITFQLDTKDTIGEPFQLDPADTNGEPYTGYEPGFSALARVGNFILPAGRLLPRFNEDLWSFKTGPPPKHDALLLLIMVLSFLAIIFTITRGIVNDNRGVKIESSTILLLSIAVVGSVFFFLGSQNAIRQFLGLVVVLLAMNASFAKRYATSGVLILIATAFHKWSFVLGVFAVFVTLLASEQVRQSLGLRRLSNRFEYWPEMLVIALAMSALGAIKLILILGVHNLDLPLVGDLNAYVLNQVQFEAFERPEVWIKWVSIAGIFALSEIVAGRKICEGGIESPRIRRLMFLFMLPWAVFPEIGSRLLMLYWMVEMVYVAWAFVSKARRIQVAGIVIFLSYGLAPNALNVLLGPSWLRSF